MIPLRVQVVDDSSLVREILRSELSRVPGIQVTTVAADPFEARDQLEHEEIDVVVLDLEMPRMDGLTFLRYLMRDAPRPVIISSSLSGQREVALACLEAGAADLVAKPSGLGDRGSWVAELGQKILKCRQWRYAAREVLPRLVRGSPGPLSEAVCRRHIFVIGASTGGPQALETLFAEFPAVFPPVVAVVHMPPGFTAAFAHRLDQKVSPMVAEARQGEVLVPGRIYLAPGGVHVLLRSVAGQVQIALSEGPRVFNQRPSVDVLFESAARLQGPTISAALLTGMGKDGASGMKAIREAGGRTVAQDEETSVVFGMPKEAIALGAAEAVLPLPLISGWFEQRILA